jgi:hypothetical protein
VVLSGHSQPWGADKVCEECIEGWLDLRFGVELTSEDEERMAREDREWEERMEKERAQK